jgi:hypothetical protein
MTSTIQQVCFARAEKRAMLQKNSKQKRIRAGNEKRADVALSTEIAYS